MRQQSVVVALHDIDADPGIRSVLIQHGGKAQVRCLRIDAERPLRWLYESDAIIVYLKDGVLNRAFQQFDLPLLPILNRNPVPSLWQ